jgi:hypothetical protein
MSAWGRGAFCDGHVGRGDGLGRNVGSKAKPCARRLHGVGNTLCSLLATGCMLMLCLEKLKSNGEAGRRTRVHVALSRGPRRDTGGDKDKSSRVTQERSWSPGPAGVYVTGLGGV